MQQSLPDPDLARRTVDRLVHVEEAHRQRGIAAAPFGALAEQARQSGVRRLAAATRYAAAIRLNERLGLASRLALRRYALGNPGRRD
jgi:GNAT superfamily N-acetyltransferase